MGAIRGSCAKKKISIFGSGSDKYCNITNLNVLVDGNLCINLNGKNTQHMCSQGLRFGMALIEVCFKEKINLNKKIFSGKYYNTTNLNVLVDGNLCINLDGTNTQHMCSQGLRFGMAQNEIVP